ncbi:MAG TPA: hypothetical protein VIV11_33860 [Kofleriaceae bacterium]
MRHFIVVLSGTLATVPLLASGQPNPTPPTTGSGSSTPASGSATPTTDPGTTTTTPPVETAPPTTTEPTPPVIDEEDTGAAPAVFTAKLYGYLDAHYEKSAAVPVGVNSAGQTIEAGSPGEWDLTNFHVMLQGNVFGSYRYFINLAAPGSGAPNEDASIGLRNAWLEIPLYRDLFNFRLGKTYRRFGLYNEILDAVPTFIGIEPPEMFDTDHLMLTRTTNAMLHGKLSSGDATISYALSTGNDERESGQIPMGADLRFNFQPGIVIGASYYSTNGAATPAGDVDAGNPIGGVANWMATDDFKVYSLFAQLMTAGVTLQAEYTAGVHDAERDPDRVATLAAEAGLYQPQLDRFFMDPSDPVAMNVITNVSYQIRAAYVRAGYEIQAGKWELVPYAQLDYYDNKENIQNEDYGGDNEAGVADDGIFYKTTLGIVLRPVRFVAVKVDGSTHTFKFNGEYFTYPEIRTSFSLYWEYGDVN